MRWADVINTVISVGIGLVTGLWFERRSNRSTQDQNRQLEAELVALRTSIYTVGADIPAAAATTARHGGSDVLSDAVLVRARSIQDPQGRLYKASLVAYFSAEGERAEDIDRAISGLCDAGLARQDGKWLELT